MSYGDASNNDSHQIAHLLNHSVKKPHLPILPIPQFLLPTANPTPVVQH